jgi:ABC-2 type transport system permease protein
MLSFVKSEWLKQKRSFNRKLLWLGPVITVLLAFVMMGSSNVQNGAYNWWYTMLLPGCYTIFSAFTVAREEKKNRHGLFGVVVRKNKLWYGQIIICTLFLFITCMIFFVSVTISGILTGSKIPVLSSFLASLLLFI